MIYGLLGEVILHLRDLLFKNMKNLILVIHLGSHIPDNLFLKIGVI